MGGRPVDPASAARLYSLAKIEALAWRSGHSADYGRTAYTGLAMAYNVFISYSTKNLHIVDWVRTTLAQPGVTEVFAAEYSVLPGQVLNAEIIRAIRDCDLFVLLWSHDARTSDYVPQEIGIAVGCNKVILPVVMEDNVPVPAFIADRKYLPAHKNWEGSFRWLTEFVHENATQLMKAKVLAAVVGTIIGGIWLFGGGDEEG